MKSLLVEFYPEAHPKSYIFRKGIIKFRVGSKVVLSIYDEPMCGQHELDPKIKEDAFRKIVGDEIQFEHSPSFRLDAEQIKKLIAALQI